MFKKSFFALFLAFSMLTAASMAFAEIPVQECGAPPPANMPTDPGGHYCNIYSRQLAYGDENSKFIDQLHERQKNFGAPGLKASSQYRDDVRKRNGIDTKKRPADETGGAGQSEAYGPESN